MDSSDKRFSELVDLVKSWMPRRAEPPNVSRDFWMPDHSCRVCYECDSQFTIFNRKHHCRNCGRVFCAKCTSSSIPVSFTDPKSGREEGERIRVCNYCFKQWQKEIPSANDGTLPPLSTGLSHSPSTASLASSKSSGNSSVNFSSMPYSTGQFHHASNGSSHILQQYCGADFVPERQNSSANEGNFDSVSDIGNSTPPEYMCCMNRCDEGADEYTRCILESERTKFQLSNEYLGSIGYEELDDACMPCKVYPADYADAESCCQQLVDENITSSRHDELENKNDPHVVLDQNNDLLVLDSAECPMEEGDMQDNESDAASSIYRVDDGDSGPVDFESNYLLWFPPEPEDEEDEKDLGALDDDENGDGLSGWSQSHNSSSLSIGEQRNKDRSIEEHKKAMKSIVEGHFRALVAQLLQAENLPVGEENDKESWLEIISSLSWEAASFLKPDTSKGGGMDPGGYVKVKCLACGRRSESAVVKGIVCKKNVAHRRMSSRIRNPKILLLGGALEYQRVTNSLSSLDTLLQQEMDHLKMAVAKIDSHQPDLLLVEKSVSRHAQEYLLAKDISLVLNVKRPLLERVARCTGAQIVPSIDNLFQQKLGVCEFFHVNKFLEEHGSVGQTGKKLLKTLMFFEGCPRPLGCTVLIRGASGDELKKVKHVIQYGVFAAYHLALETSFLADEGASLPELPLKSPITVALPDKSSGIERSISMVPGFNLCGMNKTQLDGQLRSPGSQALEQSLSLDSSLHTNMGGQVSYGTDFFRSSSGVTKCFPGPSDSLISPRVLPELNVGLHDTQEVSAQQSFSESSSLEELQKKSCVRFGPYHALREQTLPSPKEASAGSSLVVDYGQTDNACKLSESLDRKHYAASDSDVESRQLNETQVLSDDWSYHRENSFHDGKASFKEEFPPSPSDHQSILVSLSTRCVWKGTVCERAHLFRIKYYGSFDMPLGRYLHENLLDPDYNCPSCQMPPEAHVHCYTHRQGSLTISVKKLQEFMLPGVPKKKMWMWHRCLKCPRSNGIPPATRRVQMSDAAWGLSFGKFLELSFSNHAAASRVASCGHSLHRDCLRFYGFGGMVACFRYASIDVHTVYLPPSKLDFDYQNQDWIQKEASEVVDKAELFFAEIINSLRLQSEKLASTGAFYSGAKSPEAKRRVADLEEMLQMEKAEFEESMQKATVKELQKGQLGIDILEINRLRRQLPFHSYVWDHRLLYLDSSLKKLFKAGSANSLNDENNLLMKSNGKPTYVDNVIDSDSALKQEKVSSMAENASADVKLDASCKGSLRPASSYGELTSLSDTLASRILCWDESLEKTDVNLGAGVEEKGITMDPLGKIIGLETGNIVRRALSEGQFPILPSLSDTLDAAWIGQNNTSCLVPEDVEVDKSVIDLLSNSVGSEREPQKDDPEEHTNKFSTQTSFSAGPTSLKGVSDEGEDVSSWLKYPFSYSKSLCGMGLRIDAPSEYNPTYLSSFRALQHQGGPRLLLPVGISDIVVPVHDDEPTSAIAYALVSSDYHNQLAEEWERLRDGGDSTFSYSFSEAGSFHPLQLLEEMTPESLKSFVSSDDGTSTVSGTRSSMVSDPVGSTKSMHIKVSFTDEGPPGKVKYTVTCYYAKHFDALRRTCWPTELDFIRSTSRCKKWGAQGGKSNVFFAKTLDDRFIIKQVTRTELDSFIKFAPHYFKYMSDSIGSRSPTCLAKILGIYQVSSKHVKGGKDCRMDLMIMENLMFRRNLTRIYDLKGAARSRYNPDSKGSNKVLLDQNLIEAMPTSPIFVGNKAKRLLERAVWNDTSFLASIDVMDYSLLVGVDEEKHELVLGIIDFMRQYTWDKHLETWVKASGILGGSRNPSPTVISPKQYKKRFRKAMSAYFLMVPDQWSPPMIISSASQSDFCDESAQCASYD